MLIWNKSTVRRRSGNRETRMNDDMKMRIEKRKLALLSFLITKTIIHLGGNILLHEGERSGMT